MVDACDDRHRAQPNRLTIRHGLAESRMRWKPHVRFGERTGETDRPKDRHRAPVRLHNALRDSLSDAVQVLDAFHVVKPGQH